MNFFAFFCQRKRFSKPEKNSKRRDRDLLKKEKRKADSGI
jgi:hypothetical protein